jgi:hypothetical protein
MQTEGQTNKHLWYSSNPINTEERRHNPDKELATYLVIVLFLQNNFKGYKSTVG